MAPQFSNPVEWQQNVGLARTACARIFRDGGTPADALRVFNLDTAHAPTDWSTVVDRIAASMSTSAAKKAA